VFVAKSGSQLNGRHFADDDDVETKVPKWLRQQSKNLYAAGFNALIKRWDKCINVGGGYVEKCFFQVRISLFYVLYPFVTYLLTLPRIQPFSSRDLNL
jgi:hypothetical protein